MPSKHSLDLLKTAYYSVYDPALTQDQIASRVGPRRGKCHASSGRHVNRSVCGRYSGFLRMCRRKTA